MRAIDSDALERDGWKLHRTIRVDKNTMEYQVKKPTDFPAIEPERETCKGCKHIDKWEIEREYGFPSPCDGCKRIAQDNYEPDMRQEGERDESRLRPLL